MLFGHWRNAKRDQKGDQTVSFSLIASRCLMGIGDRIKQLRGQESRKSLALKLGVDQMTIARYENNERLPDAVFIGKLSNLFKITSDWLIFGEQSNLLRPKESPQPEGEGGDFKDELLNIYQQLTNLNIKLDQLRKRKDDYQAQLIGIREKIGVLLDLNHDRIKDIQVTVSVEGKEKTQALADVLADLESMADDLYVGRGDRRISKL